MKRCPALVVPELIVDGRQTPDKGTFYNSSGTQTILIEQNKDNSNNNNDDDDDKFEVDDMEIIPKDLLHDDFVQLDLAECNEQQNVVSELQSISSRKS